jgi:tetratricopeptide (TPR) repeat protein
LGISASHAEDASIDKLLSKLPPPEKIIQPSARKALERSDPAFKDSLTKQIVVAVRTWNFQQALGLSRKLTQRYPRSAGAQCLRGALAYDLRQFAEASAAFRTATNIDLKYPFAYFGLAAVEATQGQYAAAVPHLQQVLKLQPNAAGAYYVLSDCAFHLGRKEESATYARKGAALAPSDGYMWLQLAKAEKSLGHTDATLNAIAKAAQVSPDSGMMLAVLGFSYINVNRIPQAIPPLQRAARLLPHNYLVQSQLGYCLMTVGQTDAAIGYLRKGASLNSSYGPGWEHLGVAFQKRGRHRDAVDALERATRLMPTSRYSWKSTTNPASCSASRGAESTPIQMT